MDFDTEAGDTSIPSMSSSPWILGAPQRGFSLDILLIRSRISRVTFGRPRFLRRLFNRQKSLNPLRCQEITVPGLTTTSTWAQSRHILERKTQNSRSVFVNRGRLIVRPRMANCCLSARFSRAKVRWVLRAEKMVLRSLYIIHRWYTPEALSSMNSCSTYYSGGTGATDTLVWKKLYMELFLLTGQYGKLLPFKSHTLGLAP